MVRFSEKFTEKLLGNQGFKPTFHHICEGILTLFRCRIFFWVDQTIRDGHDGQSLNAKLSSQIVKGLLLPSPLLLPKLTQFKLRLKSFGE